MKKIFNISIFIIFNLFFSYTSFGNENQSKCISLYSSNNEYDWLKALPYCLKSPKGNEHKIGELYRFKNNCKESVRWFKKHKIKTRNCL